MRFALLFLTVLPTVLLSGCGGEGFSASDDAQVRLSGRSSEYNGEYADFSGDLGVEIGRDTVLTVRSGGRRLRLVLREDVLGKGQTYDLDDSGEASATYDEDDDGLWVAVDGRVWVTEEILGRFTVRLSDLEFEPADEEENAALGTFDIDGTLRRR